jgi:hypothetical protein
MLRLVIVLVVMSSLAACGTRLNPFNWFGGDREERVTVVEDPAVLEDGRRLVAEIVSLDVDPNPQGAIVRAMGRPPTQGYWEADLVEVERTDTALVYEFRVRPPLSATPAGTAPSREIITGLHVSNARLAGIRSITVIGAQNRRTVSRR